MLRGIYTGSSGMIAQQARLDVVANNLANVDKTGFKKDIAVFKAFPDMLIRRLSDNGLGITPAGSYDTMPYVGKLGTGV
jgi:flagellar basal-body rod protein FlgF